MTEKNCKKNLERNRTAIRLFAAVFSALILVSADGLVAAEIVNAESTSSALRLVFSCIVHRF